MSHIFDLYKSVLLDLILDARKSLVKEGLFDYRSSSLRGPRSYHAKDIERFYSERVMTPPPQKVVEFGDLGIAARFHDVMTGPLSKAMPGFLNMFSGGGLDLHEEQPPPLQPPQQGKEEVKGQPGKADTGQKTSEQPKVDTKPPEQPKADTNQTQGQQPAPEQKVEEKLKDQTAQLQDWRRYNLGPSYV